MNARENMCRTSNCPALCCKKNTIHFNSKEFVDFRSNTPNQYTFVEVDAEKLQIAQTENQNPNILFFNRYSPDIFSDDSQDLIRLFVVSCPFLANNECSAYGKKYRPQACSSFGFDGKACQTRRANK